MSIKALFYDFDGVIKESTQIKTEAFYSLYLPYGKEVAEKAMQHHIEHGGISRYEKFKLYHKTFLGIELNAEQVNELAASFSSIVMEKVIDCAYVPGAREAIEKLNGTFRQFVVTGTPQTEIEHILDALKIDDLFEGVYGSPSTKIELSQQILDRSGFEPKEVVFIGDATTDHNAAVHFDFHFILREHAGNRVLFEKADVLKSKDLTNLEALIETL